MQTIIEFVHTHYILRCSSNEILKWCNIKLFQVWLFPDGNKAQWSFFLSFSSKFVSLYTRNVASDRSHVDWDMKSGGVVISLSLQWIPGAPSCGCSDLHCHRPSLAQRPHSCSHGVLWCSMYFLVTVQQFRLDYRLLLRLHALTQATQSYALLVLINFPFSSCTLATRK